MFWHDSQSGQLDILLYICILLSNQSVVLKSTENSLVMYIKVLSMTACKLLFYTVFTWNKGIIFQSLVWNKQENLKSGAVRKLPTVTRVQSVESGVLFEYCYPETQENSKPVYKMPSTLLGHVQDQLTLSSSNLS